MKAVSYYSAIEVARNITAFTIQSVVMRMAEDGCSAQARVDAVAEILDGYEYFEPRFWECVREVEETTEEPATVVPVA